MFGPHGHTSEDLKDANEREITYLATECPLVTKVKNEVAVNTAEGRVTIYYGQRNKEGLLHPETRAAMSSGDAILVTSLEEALSEEILEIILDKNMVAFASQTTHNADEVEAMGNKLKEKYPNIKLPKKKDICYATRDRQQAAKAVIESGVKLVVVVGDKKTSSNTRSLAAVAVEKGARVFIVNNRKEINPADFYGADSVGVVASASAPETQIRRVIGFFTGRGSEERMIAVADESKIWFKRPESVKPFVPEIIWQD